MTRFEDHIGGVIEREGGARIVEDPDDPGGTTKYGISQRAFPILDIRNLSREQAVEIYRRRYWQPIHGHRLPSCVAGQALDHAVNAGVVPAALLLQRIVGAEPDGRIGPKTLAKTHAHVSGETRQISQLRQSILARDYALAREEYYVGVAWSGRRPLSHLVSWCRRQLHFVR